MELSVAGLPPRLLFLSVTTHVSQRSDSGRLTSARQPLGVGWETLP